MRTALYDFKRSFLRLSVLLFIIVFALAGVGLSYLIANSISSQVTNISIIGVVTNAGNETIKVIGTVLDKNANGVPNAEVYILNNKNIMSTTTTNSSGFFTFTLPFQKSNLEINVKSDIGNSSLILPINISSLPIVFGKPSSFTYGSSIGSTNIVIGGPIGGPHVSISMSNSRAGAILMNVNKYTSTGTIVIATADPRAPNNKPNYDVYYTTTTDLVLSQVKNLSDFISNLTYNYLGEVTNFISVFNIKVNSSNNQLFLKIYNKDANLTSYVAFTYSLVSPAEYSVVASMMSSLSPFAQFFPVVFLYLVYAMVAKPRSTGALEFLLARPVTRREIYLNRYIAGVLTALISSGILIITTYISMNILIGKTLDVYSLLLLYIGISGSLIAFFSLMYGISAFSRASVYLGLSIGLYLLLYLFWGVIAVLYAFSTRSSNYFDILYLTYYFNPNGLYNFMIYFIENNYGILSKVTAVNNIAVVVSSLIWIIVPTVLGYLKFKRINLTS